MQMMAQWRVVTYLTCRERNTKGEITFSGFSLLNRCGFGGCGTTFVRALMWNGDEIREKEIAIRALIISQRPDLVVLSKKKSTVNTALDNMWGEASIEIIPY